MSGDRQPPFVDRRRVLDAWRHRRTGAEVVVYALGEPVSDLGYAAHEHTTTSDRWFYFVRQGDRMVSLSPDKAVALLEGEARCRKARQPGGDRGARWRTQRLMRGVGLVAAAVVMAGCGGIGEEAGGEPVASPSPVDEPDDEEAPDPIPTPTPPPEGDDESEDEQLADCEPVQPAELIDGSDPGEPELEDDGQRATWGDGDVELSQATGLAIDDDAEMIEDWDDRVSFFEQGGQVVDVDGEDRVVAPVGDPPMSEIRIEFWRDDCPYVNWVGPGFELDDVIDYAQRF